MLKNLKLKIVFFGTSDFAVPALQSLSKEGYDIIAVVTTPDEPTGRQKILTPSPVKMAAQKFGLKILQPPSLKIDEFKNYLEIRNWQLETDHTMIGVVASYGKIIPADLLKQFKRGLLNIHPSLLPKYRGPAPIQSAILNGEVETGVSIMLLDTEIDHGPILKSIKYEVSGIKYYKEIEKELAHLGAELLITTLPDYVDGKIIPQEQDHTQATFTKKFSFADGRINWQKSAMEIFNQIRALNPEPGTWTVRADHPQDIIKILQATPLPQAARHAPGTVLIENHALLVSTGEGILQVEEVQLSGKKGMSAAIFINGHPDFTNALLN